MSLLSGMRCMGNPKIPLQKMSYLCGGGALARLGGEVKCSL